MTGDKTVRYDMISEEEFRNPPDEFRPIPFWSLNDELEDGELERQIREMKRVKIGGFFMHARVGLITPYLSEEWMRRIRTCVDTARSLGLKAWLYDELHCPSGTAGDKVRSASPDFGAKTIECVQFKSRLNLDSLGVEGEPLLWGIGRREGNRLIRFEGMDKLRGELGDGESFFLFRKVVAPAEHSRSVDSLNPRAVDTFIRLTHESYRERFGDLFGDVIPGIFTDEPCYPPAIVRDPGEDEKRRGVELIAQIPWTDGFESIFLREKGYDLLPYLPSIFFRWGDYRKIRYDFWEVLTGLYVETFTGRIFEWCEDHNLLLTGHILGEISFAAQMKYSGSTMAHYEYMGMPGIDHLGKDIGNGPGIKAASSVSEQLGKPGTLCETLGVSGWGLRFSEQKKVIDWLYVMGVNFLTPHLMHYSIRGRRKRECPPSLFIQQPWWEYERLLNDYVGRLGYMLTKGRRAVDILVIYPIRSAWVCLDFDLPTYDRRKEINKLCKKFEDLCECLMSNHWDYHLGEEEILRKHGRIADNRFVVGQYSYDCVILPECLALSGSTVALLREFVGNGGKLIALNPSTYLIDGVKERSLSDLFDPREVRSARSPREVCDILCGELRRDIEIRDPKGGRADPIVYQHRRGDDFDIYFLFNRDSGKVDVRVTLQGGYPVEEWEPGDGTRHLVSDDGRDFPLTFLPGGSHLLVSRRGSELPPEKARGGVAEELVLEGEWGLIRKDKNVLVIDYCRVRMGDRWSGRLPVWRVGGVIKDRDMGELSLRFDFEIGDDLDLSGADMELVVEDAQSAKISVNGRTLTAPPDGWWLDPSFRTYRLDGLLTAGGNRVVITWGGDFETHLENIYVRGNFAVEGRGGTFMLGGEPEGVEIGDLVDKGYPFYAGAVVYKKLFRVDGEFKEAVLAFEEMGGVIYDIRLNGRDVGVIAWPPYEISLKDQMRVGENLLEIQVVGSLRNLLGPHHNRRGDYPSTESCWRDEANWTDEYLFEPFGLISKPTISFYS